MLKKTISIATILLALTVLSCKDDVVPKPSGFLAFRLSGSKIC